MNEFKDSLFESFDIFETVDSDMNTITQASGFIRLPNDSQFLLLKFSIKRNRECCVHLYIKKRHQMQLEQFIISHLQE